MKCEQCGIIFEPKINIPTRFHDEKCRQIWHNEKRRLDNLAKDAIQAIEKLQTALLAQTSHSDDVFKALDTIIWKAKPKLKQVSKCSNCGQKTFVGKAGKCDYCGKDAWLIQWVEAR